MIEAQTTVTRVGTGKIWIKSQQNGACTHCAQQASCSTATLGKLMPKREFAVESDLNLQAGDQVRIVIANSGLLFSSILLYFLPLVGMLLAVSLANSLLSPPMADIWLPGIALLTLLLIFLLIHHFQTRLLVYICCKPRVVGKC